MAIELSEMHRVEVDEYYKLFLRCVGHSAKRGGYGNLKFTITELVAWLQAYKAGTATYQSWVDVTHAASIMFDEWRDWFNGDPAQPRAEWGGLNEYEYKSLWLMHDFREWTRDEFKCSVDNPRCKTVEDVQAMWDEYVEARRARDDAA